jgi:DNA-binding response OmpR family regulator
MTRSLLLVVDDDPRSRELVEVILRHAGFDVIAAADAHAAIELLATHQPVLALVDGLMPGMTGIEFCRWLRGESRHATMPCLLLTGLADAATRAAATEAGANDVITKPFDRLRLLERIGTLLGNTAAR